MDKSHAPVRLIVRPSGVEIPDGAPRRQPPRPPTLRPAGYGDQFDADTLFFDVFRAHNQVVAIGPPLLNLAPELRGWTFSSDGDHLPAPTITTLDRSHRARFRSPADARTLAVSAGGSAQTVPIGADLASVFAGTRALMTLQLDNELDWIHDWVRWHAAAQGTDAVVVYDNGSTRYPLADVLEAICVEGIRVAAVVDWPFRYGPQGSDALPWDSDYTQYGAIEHARRRLLRLAAGMLSVDIDELVSPSSGGTVYDEARRAPQGIVTFPGAWAYTSPGATAERPRHADCRWTRADDGPASTKWCAVPALLPRRAQLAVHGAHGVAMPMASFHYWHLRPISTHWKLDRTRHEHPAEEYRADPVLAAQLDRYLGVTGDADAEGSTIRTAPIASRTRRAVALAIWRARALAKRAITRGAPTRR